MKSKLKIIFVLLAFTSCKDSTNKKETIFLADMETPMGHNYLKIYKDRTFEFEHRQLLKKTLYKGKVQIDKDTLNFDYNSSIPDFGDIAAIDGIFLTYTNGVYRELLEISLNNISK